MKNKYIPYWKVTNLEIEIKSLNDKLSKSEQINENLRMEILKKQSIINNQNEMIEKLKLKKVSSQNSVSLKIVNISSKSSQNLKYDNQNTKNNILNIEKLDHQLKDLQYKSD